MADILATPVDPRDRADVLTMLYVEDRPSDVLLVTRLLEWRGGVALHRLRAQPGFGATPVPVLTADASSASAERLRGVGLTAYLTKPLDVGVLFAHLAVLESSLLAPAVRAGAP